MMDDCLICDSPTDHVELVTCEECRETTPNARWVLECEFCGKLWFSNWRIINTLRSTAHAYRKHPDLLEEKYG